MVAIITFPLEYSLAELVILVPLPVTVNIYQPSFYVCYEVVVLVQAVAHLPKKQLILLRLCRGNILDTFLKLC